MSNHIVLTGILQILQSRKMFCFIRPGPNSYSCFTQELGKHSEIVLTRIRVPAKLPWHIHNLWLVFCSYWLVNNIFCLSSSMNLGFPHTTSNKVITNFIDLFCHWREIMQNWVSLGYTICSGVFVLSHLNIKWPRDKYPYIPSLFIARPN